MFLYGFVDHQDPYPTGLVALLAYADLTAGGALVFALIVITSMIINFWDDLAPWISPAVSQLVVSPVRVLVSGACSFVMQLAAVRSVRELKTTLLVNLHWILYPIIVGLYHCLVPLRWFCPPNRPQATVGRLGGAFLVSTIGISGFLLPIYQFLYGIAAGLVEESREQSPLCLDMLSWYDAVWWSNRRQWAAARYYCDGEETGLQLRAIFEDDWGLYRLFDGEIYHLHAIAFVVSCALLVIMAVWSSDAISWATFVYKCVRAEMADDAATKARLRGEPLTRRESRLWDMISGYEDDLRRLTGLLTASAEELRITKQTGDDGWTQAKTLAARTREAESSQRRNAGENVQLRAQLGRLTGQLSSVQGRQVDATARVRALRDNVARLEHQLAVREEQVVNSLGDTPSLRAELQARNDQLVDIERRLAAAEAREEQSRGRQQQLEAEHQQLTVCRDTVVADNHRLRAANEELQAEYDHLFLSSESPTEATQALEAERDHAVSQLHNLHLEHVAMKQTAEDYYRETQESLAQAAGREAGLRQSLQDLKSACDMTFAQERSAAAEVRKRAEGLAAEVNDLQGRMGMALRDAQSTREEADRAKQSVADLEHRLAKLTRPQGSSQEIPKCQSGDLGSISTALAKSQVTVSKQQTEISDLKRQLEQANAGATRPAEEALRSQIAKLKKDLDTEKRARTDDQLRWSKKTRELEAENQRLTIARSNTAAAPSGGMRKTSSRS